MCYSFYDADQLFRFWFIQVRCIKQTNVVNPINMWYNGWYNHDELWVYIPKITVNGWDNSSVMVVVYGRLSHRAPVSCAQQGTNMKTVSLAPISAFPSKSSGRKMVSFSALNRRWKMGRSLEYHQSTSFNFWGMDLETYWTIPNIIFLMRWWIKVTCSTSRERVT